MQKTKKSLAILLGTLGVFVAPNLYAGGVYLFRVSVPGIVSNVAPSGIVTNGTGRSWSDDTYASSCLGYLTGDSSHKYTGATGNGAYTILVNGTPSVVWCDMTSDGGGWTLVQKASANFIPSTWSTTSAAIQTNYLTNAGFSDGTGKWADSDINSRVTVGYRLSGYYNGATPVRYVKPTCKYSQLSQPTGDCAVTYASLSWNSPLTCSAGNAAFRLGICDFAASGTFFYTADTRGGASSWFVGNDSGPSSYGGASNTSYAMFVK